MTNFPIPQNIIYNTFKGIRTRNGVVGGGAMSAVVCQNIDFIPNTINTDIQIRSTQGNVAIAQYDIPEYKLIKIFETIQDGTRYLVAYLENNLQGLIAKFVDTSGNFETLVEGLSVTGQANGITMNDTAYDVFAFTNGKEYYSINFVKNETIKLNPLYEGETITGLALAEYRGSLVIGSVKKGVVIASRQGDLTDWDTVKPADDKTKPWYQFIGKGVTAIIPYIEGLLVFTQDDSRLFTGNLSSLDFSRSDASIGGCMSFESWCFHDKYLFFYDNVQKNIYYYMQNNIGQKVLGEPIAPEVQKFFDGIDRLQMTSYVGKNRSEIWVLSNKFKLIYDYYVGEWSERVCQDLTSYFTYNNDIYSTTAEGKVLKEKEGDVSGIFDGEFYESVYTMQTINLGSYSNMKEMEMQPLFTVTENFENKFWLYAEIDGKKTKSKFLKMKSKGGVWGDDTDPAVVPNNQKWDVMLWAAEDSAKTHQIKGKFIPNWYYLQFTIKTEEKGQDFNILAFELKGITQETDTTGRK